MRDRCATCGRTRQRSTPQNARLWAILTEISERLKVDGVSFTPETWHEYFKRKYLGAKEFTLPSGETLVIPVSSADLDEDAFSDYLTRIEAWALDRNVWLAERA